MATNRGMKKEQYNLLHKRFVEKYANPKSETFGNATKSYQAAGYKVGSANAQCASTLLNTKKIQRSLREYEPPSGELAIQRVEISKDYALGKLQETYDRSVIKADVPSQIACVRLMMQYNNMLTERLVVTHADALELDMSMQRQCKQIASIIQMNGGSVPEQLPAPADKADDANTVDAVFEDVTADVA